MLPQHVPNYAGENLCTPQIRKSANPQLCNSATLRKKRHLGTRFVSFYADEDYTDEDSSDEGLTDEGHPSENHTHDDYSSGDHADENADEKMRVCSRGLPSGRCAYEFGARYCDIGPRMDAWLLAAVSGRTRTVPDYTAYGM